MTALSIGRATVSLNELFCFPLVARDLGPLRRVFSFFVVLASTCRCCPLAPGATAPRAGATDRFALTAATAAGTTAPRCAWRCPGRSRPAVNLARDTRPRAGRPSLSPTPSRKGDLHRQCAQYLCSAGHSASGKPPARGSAHRACVRSR